MLSEFVRALCGFPSPFPCAACSACHRKMSSEGVDDAVTVAVADELGTMTLPERRLGIRHRDSFVLRRTSEVPHHEAKPGASGVHVAPEMEAALRSLRAAGDDALAGDEVTDAGEETGRASSDGSGASPRPGSWTDADFDAAMNNLETLRVEGADGSAPVRKKSRMRSIAKGIASALGLRKGKKRRAAEDAAALAAQVATLSVRGAVGGAAFPAAAPSALMSPSVAPMRNARGAAADVSGADSAGGSAEEAVGFSIGAQAVVGMPLRDDLGDFTPGHRRDLAPTSILKGSALAAGDARGAASAGSARRGIVFADHQGHALRDVRFSDRLHYSDDSEHEDWPSGNRCAIA